MLFTPERKNARRLWGSSKRRAYVGWYSVVGGARGRMVTPPLIFVIYKIAAYDKTSSYRIKLLGDFRRIGFNFYNGKHIIRL